MNWFLKIFQSLKRKLFEKTQTKPEIEPSPQLPPKEVGTQLQDLSPPVQERRDPYFIQIGFDFGTSYSKCVCRDMMMNKASN